MPIGRVKKRRKSMPKVYLINVYICLDFDYFRKSPLNSLNITILSKKMVKL